MIMEFYFDIVGFKKKKKIIKKMYVVHSFHPNCISTLNKRPLSYGPWGSLPWSHPKNEVPS
jgi:hypothetical protein